MNKNKNTKNSRYKGIGRWILLVNLTAFVSAIILFLFLLAIENKVIGDKYQAEVYIRENTQEEFELLQEYITENALTTDDIPEIDKWVYNRRNVLLIIYDGSDILYDSTLGPGKPTPVEGVPAIDLPAQYHPKFDLTFADKTVQADFVTFFNMRARVTYGTFRFFICFFLILAIILSNVYRMTSYYRTLEKDARMIEEGDLNHKITVKGYGRLTELADAMERMRVSIIERHEKENELIESSHNLVLSMSHDLRTPLTVLIGYLEILSGKKYKDDKTRDVYIDKCKEKAYQIKQLSDRLFEYFLAFSTEEDVLHPEIYDKSVFSELLEDYIFALHDKGYDIDYSMDGGSGYYISLDIQLMRRVMDNLFSNITKYADKDKPVVINVFNNGRTLIFSFSNYIIKNLAEVESTNIGISVCDKIVKRHKGSLEVEKTEEKFKVIVRLPIAKNRNDLEQNLK